jgi:hypothetical protein
MRSSAWPVSIQYRGIHDGGVMIHAGAGDYTATMAREASRPMMTEGNLLAASGAPSWNGIREALSAN